MKSNNLFESAFIKALLEANIAGGEGSVFGSVNSGATGGIFPGSPNDVYAPGDTRTPKILGIGKKKKKEKIPYQRRPLPGLGKEVVI